MADDRKLWDDFRADKKYALSHIYYQHVDSLYRYGKKFSSDSEFVKDSIQELFCDLIRTRSNLGSTDNIRFYLFKSLKQKIIREIKKDKKENSHLDPDDSRDLTIVYSYEEELIKKETKSQREKMVLKGLRELSPKLREILYYRFICNFSYDQICEIMKIQYDSARKMVFRALTSLREHLKETDFILFSLLNNSRLQ